MPSILPFANALPFRLLLGWAMPPKFSLLKFLKQKLAPEEENKTMVIQVRIRLVARNAFPS